MYNEDGKIVSELTEEKTDEELAEALSGYQVKKFPWWRIGLSVLTVVAVVLMVTALIDLRSNAIEVLGESTLSDSFISDLEKKMNKIKQEKLDRFVSDPNNKEYLMDYVTSSFSRDEEFIRKMLKNAELTDPENSLYYYLAATIDVYKYDEACIEEVETDSSDDFLEKDLGKVTEWKVLDRPKYERALNYIKEAGKRQGIVNHTSTINFEKLEKFRLMKEHKELDSFGEFSAMYALWVKYESHTLNLLDTSRVFSTKFYELSKEGSEEEVKFWIDGYVKLIEALLPEHGTLVDYLVAQAIFTSPLGNMRAAATHVGMDEEAQKITRCIDKLNEEKITKRSRIDATKVDKDKILGEPYSKDSYLMQSSGSGLPRHAIEQDRIVLPSQKEGRLADHALAGRLFSLLISFFIALAMVGMWIFFFAKRQEMKAMSMQALGALTIIDGLLIVMGGIMLPLILYILINEYTALGVREWSVMTLESALVIIQFVGMLVTVLTLSMALLRWRLSVRLPELINKEKILGWVLPAMSFAAMIIVGMSDAKDETLPWTIAGMLISMSLLGWLIIVGVGAFRKKAELAKVTMCRGMISVYAVTMIVFTGLYHYYHAQEKSMVAASEEITFKEEYLGLMTIEYRTAQQMRKELQERLDLIR